VAIPTEALYTLVTDPFNLHAVSRVFLAKGRDSSFAPLLVGDLMMAEELANCPTAFTCWPAASGRDRSP
jgi:tRNA A37 threonylcarbamoyladenosine synthetase subunit TsaC/SUA5/YrdC